MEIDDGDGGPAFPQHILNPNTASYAVASNVGMSLRDHFAGAALSGLLANQKFDWTLSPSYTPEENVAQRCYAIADAMLAARKEPA